MTEHHDNYRPFYREKKKKVGNYMLTDPLAEGTFGRYRYATHLYANQQVAVKIINKKVLVRKEIARRCLRREGNVLQKLDHPNIIKLYEAMETRTSYYLVFELATGGSFLEFLIKKRCLLEKEARLFIREIVSAVDHMHVSGIIHRDLKLENILLDSRKQIKITGFGIAVLENESPLPSSRCGSPAYAAPEVFSYRKHGPGVDIWSIGVCLFAMLVGHLPFLPTRILRLPEMHALVLKGATIPTYLSRECFDLMSRMMKPMISERITMTDMLHHNWLVASTEQHIPRQPAISKLAPPVIHSQLSDFISYMHGYSQQQTSESVRKREINHISATYNLYLQSIRNGFEVPEVSELLLSRHDTSEEFLHSTQSMIVHEYIESLLAEAESPRIDEYGMFMSQSIPLYKSCISCLHDQRCKLHGPAVDTTTNIGPQRKNRDPNKSFEQYLQFDAPQHIQQYLLDSEVKNIQDLKVVNPALFKIGDASVKLPEIKPTHLCQTDARKHTTKSCMSLPLTPPNSCYSNIPYQRPHSVHSYVQVPTDFNTTDKSDVVRDDKENKTPAEAAGQVPDMHNAQETHKSRPVEKKDGGNSVDKIKTHPEEELWKTMDKSFHKSENRSTNEENADNFETVRTHSAQKVSHLKTQDMKQSALNNPHIITPREQTEASRNIELQNPTMTDRVTPQTALDAENIQEATENLTNDTETQSTNNQDTFRPTVRHHVIPSVEDGTQNSFSVGTHNNTPDIHASLATDGLQLNLSKPPIELHPNVSSSDYPEQTMSEANDVTPWSHSEDPEQKTRQEDDHDTENGLRDPYAEEIWIAMYPRTTKLKTHFDVSPRIPVSFNQPLTSRKPLTSRRTSPSNPSIAILRKMASSNLGINLTTPDGVDNRRISANDVTVLPNINGIISPGGIASYKHRASATLPDLDVVSTKDVIKVTITSAR